MSRCLQCDAAIPSVEDFCSNRCKVAYETPEFTTPHVCPPLSDELRRRIEAEKAKFGDGGIICSAQADAFEWLLREADSLASQTGEK